MSWCGFDCHVFLGHYVSKLHSGIITMKHTCLFKNYVITLVKEVLYHWPLCSSFPFTLVKCGAKTTSKND